MTGQTKKPRPPASWEANEWFMCAPMQWRESYISLDANAFRVGVTLVWLMYERDGPVKAPPRYLAGLCNLTVGQYEKALDKLIAAKKLAKAEDGTITQHKAEEVMQIRRKLRGGRRRGAEATNEARWGGNESATLNQHEPETEKPADAAQKPNESSESAVAQRQPSDDKEKEKGKGSTELSNESSGGPPAPPPDLSHSKPAKRDDWATLGKLLRPDHEGWAQAPGTAAWKRARDAGGRLVNRIQSEIKISLGDDRRSFAVAVLGQLVDLAERLSPEKSRDVGYLIEVARGLVAERFGTGNGAPTTQFKIVIRDGRRIRINLKTGEETAMTEAA